MIIALLEGCFLVPPSDPPPPRDAGPSDAGPDTAAWRLHDVARGPHEPGTWLSFEVDGVDVDPRAVSLWVIDDDYDVPFYTVRAAAPTPPEPTLEDVDAGAPDAGPAADAGTAPRSYTFVMPLPIVRAGTFRVAVGTAEGPLTREIPIDVVVPAPRMTQAAAADAMRAGIVGVHADVAALIGSDAPEWQQHLASTGASDIAGGFAAMADDYAMIIEVQGPRLAFHEEGFMVVAWGRFDPQNRTAGSELRSLEDLVIASFEAALPGGAPRRGVRAAIGMVGEFVRSRLPAFGAELIFQSVDPPVPLPSLLLPLDLGFYNVTLADVISINPALAPLTLPPRVIYDPELISPVSVTARTTGATARADYAMRDISIHDLDYPGAAAVEQVTAIAQLRGFAFVSEGASLGGVQLLQFPFPETIHGHTRIISVQSAPDPANPSQSIADEDFIVLDVNVTGGTTRRITADTTELRVHTMIIRDLFTSFDQTRVDVVVNGTAQYTSHDITSAPNVPLTLVPGLNTVAIVSTAGHTGLTCSDGSEVCVAIELPDADNVNRLARMRGPVGVSRELRIWTPPVHRAAMAD